MKKSVVITIFIIYIASIIAIGFFGIKLKVYDEVKYVKEIKVSVETTNEDAIKMVDVGKNSSTGNNEYKLYVDYTKFETRVVEKDGAMVEEVYFSLSLIPQVTYDSGELASGKGEKIKYTTLNQNYVDKGFFTLDEYGFVTIYRQNVLSFSVMISPENRASFGSSAKVTILLLSGLPE